MEFPGRTRNRRVNVTKCQKEKALERSSLFRDMGRVEDGEKPELSPTKKKTEKQVQVTALF